MPNLDHDLVVHYFYDHSNVHNHFNHNVDVHNHFNHDLHNNLDVYDFDDHTNVHNHFNHKLSNLVNHVHHGGAERDGHDADLRAVNLGEQFSL